MNEFSRLVDPKPGQTSYIFFSGKGGVGKTTIAAATALRLAEAGHRTLIVSTDLQRSLDDVFGQRLEDVPTPIAGHPNLSGVTVDPPSSMEKYRGKVLETLELVEPDSIVLKQMRADATSDCGCAQAALFEFLQYLGSSEFDAIVFDTAPLGAHLEKLSAQNRYALSLTEQAETKERLAELLHDDGLRAQALALREVVDRDDRAVASLRSAFARYLFVMIPEKLPFRELERNLTILEQTHRIPIRGIVVNQVIPEPERDRTEFWRARSVMQQRYVDLARSTFQPRLVTTVDLRSTETIGSERLRGVGSDLFDRAAE